ILYVSVQVTSIMVGAVAGGYPALLPADRGVREQVQSGKQGDPWRELAQPAGQTPARRLPERASQTDYPDTAALQHRIEARARAATLELEHQSSLSLHQQQALSTYQAVASGGIDHEVELVGLDLEV